VEDFENDIVIIGPKVVTRIKHYSA